MGERPADGVAAPSGRSGGASRRFVGRLEAARTRSQKDPRPRCPAAASACGRRLVLPSRVVQPPGEGSRTLVALMLQLKAIPARPERTRCALEGRHARRPRGSKRPDNNLSSFGGSAAMGFLR